MRVWSHRCPVAIPISATRSSIARSCSCGVTSLSAKLATDQSSSVVMASSWTGHHSIGGAASGGETPTTALSGAIRNSSWILRTSATSPRFGHRDARQDRHGRPAIHIVVYAGVMTRTNIDLDDELVERAMRTFGIDTKRQVVQLALERLLGGGPMSVEEQLEMEGVGWDGDLDEMRADRLATLDAGADR